MESQNLINSPGAWLIEQSYIAEIKTDSFSIASS